MAALIALVVTAGFLTWFSIYRAQHRASRGFPDKWWAVANHIVFAGVVLLTVVVAFLPGEWFGPAKTIDRHSGIVISGAVCSFLLAPLTILAGAMVTFVRNTWARRIVLGAVWLLTVGVLSLHVQAWLQQ